MKDYLNQIEDFKSSMRADIITNDEEEISRKEKTIKAYSQRLKTFFRYLDENNISIDSQFDKIRILKEFMKAGYMRNGKRRVYSKSTINLLEVALNKFFLYKNSTNPFQFSETEKRTQRGFLKANSSETQEFVKHKMLSKEEYGRIIDYIENGSHKIRDKQKLKNAVLLMLCFGLRVSELRRLEKTDFTINGHIKLHVKPSKRGKARDTFYIFGDKYKAEILDIVNTGKFNFRIRTVAKQIERIAKKLGIGQLSTHSFRHTFATTYLVKGGSIESLAGLLGHSDIKTTQIYGKIVSLRIEQELDNLPNLELVS